MLSSSPSYSIIREAADVQGNLFSDLGSISRFVRYFQDIVVNHSSGSNVFDCLLAYMSFRWDCLYLVKSVCNDMKIKS